MLFSEAYFCNLQIKKPRQRICIDKTLQNVHSHILACETPFVGGAHMLNMPTYACGKSFKSVQELKAAIVTAWHRLLHVFLYRRIIFFSFLDIRENAE